MQRGEEKLVQRVQVVAATDGNIHSFHLGKKKRQFAVFVDRAHHKITREQCKGLMLCDI